MENTGYSREERWDTKGVSVEVSVEESYHTDDQIAAGSILWNVFVLFLVCILTPDL